MALPYPPQMASKSLPSENILRTFDIHRTTMTSFGQVIYNAGGRYGPRIQDRYEFIFLHEGNLLVEIDGTEILVDTGEVGLLKPVHREFLRFSDLSSSRQSWCILRKELIPHNLISRIAAAPFSVRISPEIQAILDLALRLPEQISPATSCLLDYLGLSILSAFLREAEMGDDQHRILPEAVARAVGFITTNLARPITLVDIAAAACVTPHHLIKLFRKSLQITPVKYLWNIRLQHGGELLRTTVLGVSEIAFRVGYQSPFHFSRNFKAVHGISPKAYRDQLWKSGA